ncbi:hypothetical protein NHQ30_002573 [Ciborinia camelliae]|nr:hypothetical protein NHQ30_002573 [Ciborinia camelliae]
MARAESFRPSPYKFEAPWNAWEFAYHILHKKANVVVLSMAWRTTENGRSYHRQPREPDMETLAYWLARLEPVIRAEQVGEIIVVFANRTGIEEEAVYTGTSAVLGICAGEVKVYGILGRGEKALLVADTHSKPIAKLVSEPKPPKPQQKVRGIKPPPPISTPPMVSPEDMFSNITPISPVEPTTPHSYYSGFGGKRDNAPSKLDTTLTSTSTFDRTPTPFPEPPAPFKPSFPPPTPPGESSKSLPPINSQARKLAKQHMPQTPATETHGKVTFPRPSSPKSRNASRTRESNKEETSLMEPVILSSDCASESDEPAIVALLKGVLEEKIKVDTVANPSRPSTTQSYSNPHISSLRTKSRRRSPRPKSMEW